MITVRIGESERELSDATPEWVNEQITRRKNDGVSVCVRVLINSGSLNLTLSTPTCGGGGGGGRPPNAQESEILSLWEKLHLNTAEFSGGNLVAFLKQLS
jgi:hypothetical protein